MSLKALKEKRARLINELEEMVTGLEKEGEIRALTEEERNNFDTKKTEIESIDATIARVEETRAKEVSEDAVKELTETRDKAEIEKRALESFFRGRDLNTEERAVLASTSSNQALFPLEISKSIMQRLEELCPVLEMARRFSSKGTLRLIKEDSYGQAAITPENTKFHDTDVVFANIELRAFKVSAMVQASFEMLANSEIDLSGYLMDVIIRRLSKEINRLFILGTGTNEPQGLTHGKQTHTLSSADATKLNVQDFIMMQTTLNPAYLDKCCWFVNRQIFQQMATMVDNIGRPFLTTHVIKEKIQYQLLGSPVVVDANLDAFTAGKKPIILANIGEAYAINVLTDITVRHLVETGFTQGMEAYAGYLMMDGRLINDDAMVIGVVPSTKSK